jgi:hypothetical protein
MKADEKNWAKWRFFSFSKSCHACPVLGVKFNQFVDLVWNDSMVLDHFTEKSFHRKFLTE